MTLSLKPTCLLLLLLLSFASAQSSPEARAELQLGRAAAQRALASYSEHHIDQNLWQEAIRHGNRALALAPDALEVHRFLAESYTTTRFFARAWESWTRYYELSLARQGLDSAALRHYGEAGHALASSRSAAGDVTSAALIYEQLVTVNPGDAGAFSSLGGIYLARGEPERALPYWQEALRLQPGDERAGEAVKLITDGLRYGVRAAGAVSEGNRAYEEGRLEAALALFQEAVGASPDYYEAVVGAAKSSQALGQWETATSLWQRALRLEPASEAALSALELLEDQQRWGVQAATMLRSGLQAEEEGWMAEAAGYFRLAAAANPRYKDAFVLLARNRQALGELEQAFHYWQQVLRLDREDLEARRALLAIEGQVQRGVSGAFYRGLEHYRLGNLQAAAERFGVATILTPQHEAAWAWLARVHLERGDYRTALRHYEQALSLNPAEVSYRYYLQEARRHIDEGQNP